MSNLSEYPIFTWNGPCPLQETYFFTEDYARSLLWSDFDVTFVSIIVPIIAALGITLNSCFIYVTARIKSMRTITNFFLLNIAVADMLLLISVFTQDNLILRVFSSGVAYNAYAGGDAYCSYYAISRETFYIVSMALITLVTTERFYAICYPLKHRVVEGKRRAAKLVIATWLIGTAYGTALALNYSTQTTYCVAWPPIAEFANMPSIIGFCFAEIIPAQIAIYTVELIGAFPFAISLSMSSFMYLQIYRALGRRPDHSEQKDDATRQQAANADKTRRHVARMLLTNTVAFFVCNLPGWLKVVLQLVDDFTEFSYGTTVSIRLYQMANVMALLNSTVNPIIYNVTNPRYRQAFREAFSMRPRRQHRASGLHSSTSMRVTTVTQVPGPPINVSEIPENRNI